MPADLLCSQSRASLPQTGSLNLESLAAVKPSPSPSTGKLTAKLMSTPPLIFFSPHPLLCLRYFSSLLPSSSSSPVLFCPLFPSPQPLLILSLLLSSSPLTTISFPHPLLLCSPLLLVSSPLVSFPHLLISSSPLVSAQTTLREQRRPFSSPGNKDKLNKWKNVMSFSENSLTFGKAGINSFGLGTLPSYIGISLNVASLNRRDQRASFAQ